MFITNLNHNIRFSIILCCQASSTTDGGQNKLHKLIRLATAALNELRVLYHEKLLNGHLTKFTWTYDFSPSVCNNTFMVMLDF